MALTQVTPGQYNYGSYANPQMVRYSGEGAKALGEGIGSAVGNIATVAANKIKEKKEENKKLNAENLEKQKSVRDAMAEKQAELQSVQERMSQFQQQEQAANEIEVTEQLDKMSMAESHNNTLVSLSELAGNLQMEINSFTKALGDLQGLDTAKERRQYKRGQEGSRAEKKASLEARYQLVNDQVDSLVELNNLDIDPALFKNVNPDKVLDSDLPNFYLTQAIATGNYSSRIDSETGLVFVDYTYKDANGKIFKGTKSAAALADNIEQYTKFGFKFDPNSKEAAAEYQSLAIVASKGLAGLMNNLSEDERNRLLDEVGANEMLKSYPPLLSYIDTNLDKFIRDTEMKSRDEVINFVTNQVVAYMQKESGDVTEIEKLNNDNWYKNIQAEQNEKRIKISQGESALRWTEYKDKLEAAKKLEEAAKQQQNQVSNGIAESIMNSAYGKVDDNSVGPSIGSVSDFTTMIQRLGGTYDVLEKNGRIEYSITLNGKTREVSEEFIKSNPKEVVNDFIRFYDPGYKSKNQILSELIVN